MEAFIEYYKSSGNKSNNTITALKQSIKRIEKLVEKSIDKWNKTNLKPELVNSLNSNSSKIQTLTTLNRYYEYKNWDNEKIKSKLNELVKERTENRKSQMQPEKEKENWVDYNDLKSKIEELATEYLEKKKSFTNYRNFLLLSLFTLIPPARLSNYNMLYKTIKKRNLKSYPKKSNYIGKIDNHYRFIMNQYKTSKYLGSLSYDIPEDNILNKLIDKWFNEYNTHKKYFLVNYNGEEMKQTNMTAGLKNITRKLLNKELSLNTIRHIYFTEYSKHTGTKTIEELEKELAFTGHKFRPNQFNLYTRKEQLQEDDNNDEEN